MDSLLYNISNRDKQEKGSSIFYRIIDFSVGKNAYFLQCINTRAVFYAGLEDLVFDIDILYGLHPAQACYVGIKYSSCFSTEKEATNITQKSDRYLLSRYGALNIFYRNRWGNICFINKETGEEFLMDPCDIALSEQLIQEFDASQAFYIGIFAGLKLDPVNIPKSDICRPRKNIRLKLIKGGLCHR